MFDPAGVDSAKPSLPRAFGQYELIREVARGGMGIVYLASQTPVNRLVAVKVLAAGPFAAPDFVRRFRTEAEAVAKLDHPNIVPIYEIGECDGQPFFSMKFVDGGSLLGRIAHPQSHPPDREAAGLLIKLARAVHYAHQRGILHRDIKPANVLLDANGEPHLTDFGLARLVEKDSTLTRTMVMLGTPSYMSPEQARGQTKQLTTAVDVYGLGAVLYELLTGRPPFAGGTTMETVRQVLENEPRRPSSVRSGVDRDLETICLKCLEKEPARRYGSAEALATDLERWLNQEPILARPATRLERGAKFVRRHPVGASFSLTLCLIIAVSVAVLARANVRIRKAQGVETTLREQAERRAEESRRQLVHLSVSTGNRLADEGDFFRALLWFNEALRLDQDDPTRQEVHRRRIATVLRQSPELAQIWFHNGVVYTAEFSPDGNRVVSRGLFPDVPIWDIATGTTAAPLLRHDTNVYGARFTPDGKRVVTVDTLGRLQFWDAALGERIGPASLTNATTARVDLDFSPDGQWMAVGASDGMHLFDLSAGTSETVLPATGNADFVCFGSDSRHLATAKGSEVLAWNLERGTWASKTLRHPSALRSISFNPNGETLVAATLRGLFVWNLARGELVGPMIPLSGDLFDCRFSADGKWFVTASWDRAIRLFAAEDMRPVSDFMRHRAGVGRSIFSPDSRLLATASWDHTARVWDPAKAEPASPWLPHGGYVLSVSFSPDGRRLATASQDQTVRVWNLRTNGGAQHILRLERWVIGLQFSEDGQRLLTCAADGRASIWDPRNGRLLVTLPRVREGISHGSLSPDGKLVATAGEDGSVRLHNSETGEQVARTARHPARAVRVFFSPDGRRIVSTSEDGTARVWNAPDGSPVTPLLHHERAVRHAAFSPDGRRVLTASSDRTAQLWDAQTGERIGPAMKHAGHVLQAHFSPDGRRIVTACNDTRRFANAAQMWDTTTSSRLGPEMPHLDGVLCAQFSPDGRYIATGSEDRTAVIWDATTGARLTQLPHQSSYVTHALFSPDSRFLLTLTGVGSDSPAARVWECATGEPVTPLMLHSADFSICAWNPNSREIAIGSYDGTVSLWNLSPMEGSVEALRREAEILSAHRLESNHRLMPLSAKEMHERWDAKGR